MSFNFLKKAILIPLIGVLPVFSMTKPTELSEQVESGKKNTIKIELSSNPTTGFSWQCEIQDSKIAELTSDTYTPRPVPKGIVGSGGTQTFIFTCKNTGTTAVTFTYKRPWEGGETAEVRLSHITVDSNGNGTLIFDQDYQKIEY